MPAGLGRKRPLEDLRGRERITLRWCDRRGNERKPTRHTRYTPPTPLKRGHWTPPTGTLAGDLRKDLAILRRQEARFLHKLLLWPTYTKTGKVRRRHTPVSLGTKTYGRDGYYYGIPYIRQELLAVATRKGADLKAARRFRAAADMRRNLQVWWCSPEHCSMVNGFKVFRRRGDKTGEFDIGTPDEKEHAFGAVVQVRGMPHLNVTELATGETHLYRVFEEQYDIPKHEKRMPPFLCRQLGLHNGAALRRTYAGVRQADVPRQVRAQLRAAQSLEARWAAYDSRLSELTQHGWRMKAYARASGAGVRARGEGAREIRARHPEAVAEFEAADADGKRRLFSSFDAADYAGQVLAAYLVPSEWGDYGLDEPGRQPLESGIADMEVRHGPPG